MIAAPPFNLTIVSESVEAGNCAKQFSDQFMAETAVDRSFELKLWNFGVLGIPEIRNTAASTAAIADLVVLSMSGTVPLPAHAREWIEMWLWLIDNRRPAVVALFADHHRQGAAIQAYLRRSVVVKKLDFFPIVPRAGTFLTNELKEKSGVERPRNSAQHLPPNPPGFAVNGIPESGSTLSQTNI